MKLRSCNKVYRHLRQLPKEEGSSTQKKGEKEEEIRNIKRRRESNASRMRERHIEEREALEKKMELERELERKETLLEVMNFEEAKDAEFQLRWRGDKDGLEKMREASLQVIGGTDSSTHARR